MSASPTDPTTRRRLWAVPTRESDAGFSDEDDGYWCSCSSSVLQSPSGEIVLLGVDGELDAASLPAVAAMLERTLSSPASSIVVSLSGLMFCSVRGATLLLDTATSAAQRGIGYSVSGAPAQLRRLWSMLVPSHRQPAQFPTTERALIDVLSRPDTRSRTRTMKHQDGVPAVVENPEESQHLSEADLITAAQAGDVDAYRQLVHRTRRRVYSSALNTLTISEDPDDLAHDIATRLRDALATLISANP